MRKWTKKEFENALLLVQDGLSYVQIAERIGRSHRAVSLKMQRAGISWKTINPKEERFCIYCGVKLVGVHQKLFCSHSCSAIYNNKKNAKPRYCDYCGGIIHNPSHANTHFCSRECFQNERRESFLESWRNGDVVGWVGKVRKLSGFVRNYMLNKYGTACMICGWDKKHPVDGKSLTEINHKDGDAENCSEENLEILCPNCHSMTPNFRARNKSSKRNRKNGE